MEENKRVEEINHAKEQARAQLASVTMMIVVLERAEQDGDDDAIDNAQQIIQEDPLSIRVRDGWRGVSEPGEIEEYEILLCTGGPAVRIIGKLDEHTHEPETATLQYQDWGTPWTEYIRNIDEEKILIKYASQFYFSEL